MSGKVLIVGAGPGDPELITIKALKALASAEVVLYDRLVHPEILAQANPSALKIYVGKAKNSDCKNIQERINDLLVQHAKNGKTVVRLKGGDPFVFGRGSEEALWLKRYGVPFEIIPGISSSIAAAESALIPLTDRRISSAYAVFSGHSATHSSVSEIKFDRTYEIDWELAAKMPTVVFLMGLSKLELISEELIKHGRDKDTPVAVIEKGTTLEEKVVTGNLGNIAQLAAVLKSPAVIVVGEVVKIRDLLLQTVEKTDLLDISGPEN